VGGYREYAPPADARHLVACLWENGAVSVRPQLVIPDGCVDIMWLSDELVLAGADTRPVWYEPVGSPVHGVRLRPGAAGGVLGLPAQEFRDQLVPLATLWPEADALAERLAAADRRARLSLLLSAVLGRRAEPDELVAAAARRLADAELRVATLAADLGVSERYLHRRMVDAVGYGPKMLGRVARLRRLIALDGGALVDRAVAAGYASQSHMNDEVRRLTGRTPVRFLEDSQLTAA
jgi:methylphosphotriester-DNA--protein-cysteine methyltransferase